MNAERKSIYSDLDVLSDLGYDVHRRSGPGGGAYLGAREFELAELKLLVDAVESSRFITKKKSAALIAKLEGLTSRHQARTLQRQVFMGQWVKSMNESAYYCVDAIHTAIAARQMVSFRYFDYNSRKEKVFRRDGALYRVSVCPERSDLPRDFDPAAYVGRYFSMFSGTAARVKLRCPESLAGVILDRFGREVMLVPDQGGFTVTLDVVVSPQFWGWLAALGPEARLVEPREEAEAYRAYLQSLLAGL